VLSDTTQKNKEFLLDAGKEVGLEVNSEKNNCMSVSSYQKAGLKDGSITYYME
jgi:hypothetical protein